MNKELWVAVFTFLAGVITLASQIATVPPELLPWLAFAVAVINLALATFFGAAGYKARQAARAAK